MDGNVLVSSIHSIDMTCNSEAKIKLDLGINIKVTFWSYQVQGVQVQTVLEAGIAYRIALCQNHRYIIFSALSGFEPTTLPLAIGRYRCPGNLTDVCPRPTVFFPPKSDHIADLCVFWLFDNVGGIGTDAFLDKVPKDEIQGTDVWANWSTIDGAFQNAYAVW